MKTKPDPEKTISFGGEKIMNEKLDDVTFEQAQKLQKLGFDWMCGAAYDKNGNDVNWTTKHFFCWRPTVQLALKFLRKRFQIGHTINARSWSKNLLGYDVCHSIPYLNIPFCDFTEEGDEDEDGIVSFDFDEAEKIALDQAIRYILKNFERDFSWLKPGVNAYMCRYGISGKYAKQLEVIEKNDKLKYVKVNDDGAKYNISFSPLYSCEEECLNTKDE